MLLDKKRLNVRDKMVNQCKPGMKRLGTVCISKKAFRDKTTTGFDTSLTFYSLFGFLAIIFIWLFNLNITLWAITVLMVTSGIAFLYEGRVRELKKMFADGRLDGAEIIQFGSILFGALAIIVGVLSIPLFEIQSVTLTVVTGIIASFMFILIIVQTWVVD